MTPAEKSVLSGLLEAGGNPVQDIDLKPHDFSTPFGATIFRAIVDLVEQGKLADTLTVASGVASNDPVIMAAGGPPKVWEITDSYVPESAIASYVEIVARDSRLRQVEMVANALRQGVDGDADVHRLISEAQSRLESIESSTAATYQRVGDGIDETIAALDRKPTFVESPWDGLNRLIHGWKRGALYVIGARPSVGKTVMGLQAALSLCNVGPVALTSLEMSKEELEERLISHLARVDMGHIERSQITNEDRENIARARHLFDHMPMYVDSSEDNRIGQVVKFARKVKRDHGLAAVVLDYVGLLDGERGQSEYDIITAASKRLKRLAQELQVPVIILSQLNRGLESRDSKMPKLSDLRNSGSLEQDADTVILMHRDLTERPDQLFLNVAKNRKGSTGVIELDFAGHHSEIRDGRF